MRQTTTPPGGVGLGLSGAYQLTSGNNLRLAENYNGALRTGLGNAFSINLSSGVAGGGVVTYFSRTN